MRRRVLGLDHGRGSPVGAWVCGGGRASELALSETEQAHPAMPPILTLRDQAKVENAILADRLEMIIPKLMRDQKIDMWVLVAREYLEDPVVATMLNAESLRARRCTILVFYGPSAGKPVERLTVGRYGLGGLFEPAWNPERQPDQWKALADLIAARNPAKIAVNVSSLTAFADEVLTASQRDDMLAALAPALLPHRLRRGPGRRLAGDPHADGDEDLPGHRAPGAFPDRGGVFRPG